jgi:hypothetical protein
MVVLNGDPRGEAIEGVPGWDPFDLGPIGAGMTSFGIEKSCVESGFIAQEEEAFGVGVEPTQRIHPGWEREFRERPVRRSVGRELAENAVWLVESDQHRCRRTDTGPARKV